MERADLFYEAQGIYQEDPVQFFEDILDFKPDPWQADVARDIVKYPWVSVRSGHGVGKTALQAALMIWFLCCFPNSRVVATAPTRQQLYDVLWAEASKWISRSPLAKSMLIWTKTRISFRGHAERWYGTARTATKVENMQGYHEDFMLFLTDEASGIPDPIIEAIQGTLTGKFNRWGMFSNPTKTSGIFYDSHNKSRSEYKVHQVSSRDSSRASKKNIESLERNYGKDSNVVRVRIDGEFPLAEDDVYIPLPLLEPAVCTKIERQPGPITSIHIGADIARFGSDKTIIGYKLNEQAFFHKKIKGQDTMRTAADIVMLAEQLREKHGFKDLMPVKVDDGGVGGGVVDRLKQMITNHPERYGFIKVIRVNFGRLLSNNKNYHDTTSYMMSIVKNLLQPYDEDGNPKPVELIIPDDDHLIGQLSCRKYSITDRNKTVVESKKAMKKRNLPSPDEADCLLLLCLPVNLKKKERSGAT